MAEVRFDDIIYIEMFEDKILRIARAMVSTRHLNGIWEINCLIN